MDTKKAAEMACQAAVLAASLKTRADHLRDVVAETLAAVGGDRVKTSLGEVRLDGANGDPKPYIVDDDAYASWVAERYPSQVTATITVPADRLPDALEALEFAGVDDFSARVVPTRDGLTHMGKASLEPDGDGWVAVSVDGEVIPGVKGRRPEGSWKVCPNRSVLAEAKGAALDEVRRELAALEAAPDAVVIDGDVEPKAA